MKKATLTLCLLVGAACNVLAGDARFSDFAVRQAHQRGFTGCDKGIRDVFESAAGEDIRVMTSTMKETAGDQLQMAAIWGDPGDTILVEATLRTKGGRCYAQSSSTILAASSCDRWLAAQSAFSLKATVVGVGVAVNAGGVDAILRPGSGDSCVITYRRGTAY